MRWVFLTLVLFVLMPLPVSAAEPDYVFRWVEVLSDMEAGTEEYNMELSCLGGEMEYLDIAGIAEIDEAASAGGELRVEVLDYSSRIFFDEPISEGESQFIYLKVSDVEPKSVEGDIMYYKSFAFPKKVEDFRYTVALPEMVFPEISSHDMACTENCTCDEGGACTCENCLNCLTCQVGSWTSAVTLDPDEITIANDRLYLTWEKTLAAGERFQVGIIYPEKKSRFLLYFFTFAFAFAFVFAVGFLKAQDKRKGEVVQVFLNEEERLITDFIRNHGGEVLQKEIWQAESIGFSRPKVTRLITDLEERRIIKREPYKKTFKVVLVGY